MNVLILGDSMSFPVDDTQQSFCDAWPQLLLNSMIERGQKVGCFWYRARGGSTVYDVIRDLRLLRVGMGGPLASHRFDLTICQVGVVDCFPRPYPKWFYDMLWRTPAGRRSIRRLHRHYRLLCRCYGQTWTSKRGWVRGLHRLIDQLRTVSDSNLFVEIAPPGPYLLDKADNVAAKVADYNRLLRAAVVSYGCDRLRTVDPYASASAETLLMGDGTHLTSEGHHAVATSLLRAVEFQTRAWPRANGSRLLEDRSERTCSHSR